MTPLERAGYIAHGHTAAHRNKVARAMRLIAEHRDYAVSISWGKDSGVMLHMAAMVCPNIRVINIRYPHWAERLADHDRVRDEMLARPEMAVVRYIELPAPGMCGRHTKNSASTTTTQPRGERRRRGSTGNLTRPLRRSR